MATTYRNIAQIVPAAATNTDLYTVPSATSVVVSSIIICNQNSTTGLVRVALRSGVAASGAGLAAIGSTATPSGSSWLLFDVNIYAGSTLSLTLGVTATATEVFTVNSTIANVSFQLYGSVIT